MTLELRENIFEFVFYSLPDKETIKPQADSERKNTKTPKNDITALLVTCRQINEKASNAFRRLPQSYRSIHNGSLCTFNTLTPNAWQGLRDLTITVHGLFCSSAGAGPRWRPRHPVNRSVRRFATVLASSDNLQRLHIIPFMRHLDSDPCSYTPCSILVEIWQTGYIDVIKELWQVLKPLAYLQSKVSVTTTAEWECYAEECPWDYVNNHDFGNCERYRNLFEDGFVAMRKVLAGMAIESGGVELELPGLVDDDGRPIIV